MVAVAVNVGVSVGRDVVRTIAAGALTSTTIEEAARTMCIGNATPSSKNSASPTTMNSLLIALSVIATPFLCTVHFYRQLPKNRLLKNKAAH
jgi:hypothetical protein